MRASFTRVLKAVAASAAVSGSVFASIWLLAVKPEGPQAPRAAAGASSTVVHARHCRPGTTAVDPEQSALAALPSFTLARVGLGPSRATCPHNQERRAAASLRSPAHSSPSPRPRAACQAPIPRTGSEAHVPRADAAPVPLRPRSPSHRPRVSRRSGSGSSGPAVVSSAPKSTSAASRRGKAPVTSRGGGKGKTTKPTGPKTGRRTCRRASSRTATAGQQAGRPTSK